MKTKQFKTDLAGRELKVEIGRMAQQANGSVLLTYGQTTVLATCAMSKRPSEADYLPLTVDYEEKLYAAGKIKSGRFMKREGRASDEAVSTGRMIDRVLRPRFDKRIRNNIHIVLTILSFDRENDPDIPALIAASLALGISDIPWQGPMAGLRIGRLPADQKEKGQEWVLNPSYQSREQSDLDLVVAGNGDKINMLEGDAHQLPEEVLLSAIEFVQPHVKKVIQFQKEIIDQINPTKVEVKIKEIDEGLVKKVKEWLGDKLEQAIYKSSKTERLEELDDLSEELVSALSGDSDEKESQIRDILEDEIDRIVHKNILKASVGKEKRPDGRKLDEVRSIKSQISVLSRTHGSGLFERGATQALSVITLGAPSDKQLLDGMEIEGDKQFMHHYNFPPFCTGETGFMRGPGRREIGHGSLAEKALQPLIPDNEQFPYTIRIVSEILSSNGSSSMASVSGSSLALMDAGVPIKEHVTGLAIGLMMESVDNYKILTDIQGPEDHYGDMDCKVAGTSKGVTACQMDVKIEGVTLEILKKAFAQAKKARFHILETMTAAIDKPRTELSSFAPRVISLRIDPDKIRDVIGPGGKMINSIIDQTGAKIDIEDDGLINITSIDQEGGQQALEKIKNLTREIRPGEVFQGRVTKIIEIGAFVEILPGQEGLVHISELAPYRVEKVEDVVRVGQEVVVKVKNVDERGRINLSLKEKENK